MRKPKTEKQIEASRRNGLIAQKYAVIAVTGKKKQQRECKCIQCGNIFWTFISRIKQGRGRFCNRRCKGIYGYSIYGYILNSKEAHRKAGLSIRGERNSRWVGTARSHRDRIWRCEKNIEWKKEIMNRDNYTCQICHKRGGILEIDHIKPFSIIINEYNIRTFEDAMACDELWDISNGRVLCVSCHRQTETYGQGTRNLLKNMTWSVGKFL